MCRAFYLLQNDLALHLRVKHEYVHKILIMSWPHVDYGLKITTTLQKTILKNVKSKYFSLWRPLQIELAILGLRVKKVPCKKPLSTRPRIDLSFKWDHL